MHASRRSFLYRSLAGSAVVSLGGMAPPLFHRAAGAAQRAGKHAQGDNILLVVQLSGGNDGLNTVVPANDPLYRRARPSLAVPANNLLTIDQGIGWHPAMAGIAELTEEGLVSVIQGVGYPNPNRSHFESMDIWHSCQTEPNQRSTGWLGRYADGLLTNQHTPEIPGLHLGEEKQPLALASEQARVPTVRSLEQFRIEFAHVPGITQVVETLARLERTSRNDLLDFVRSTTLAALQTSEQIGAVQDQASPTDGFPDSNLGRKLETVWQLIDAGLDARVYYVTLDGFDTHAKQAGAHEGLLRQLSEALTAFQRRVSQGGHGQRLMTMVFSEFGRRVEENASAGTDHGAAAPVLLVGERVRPGLIGEHPSLEDLEDGDLRFHTDFRQVYAAVLSQWLGTQADKVLGGSFAPVDVVQASR